MARVQITDDEIDGLRIDISASNWLSIIESVFIGVWLVFWAFFEVTTPIEIIVTLTHDPSRMQSRTVFMLEWLLFWTILGFLVATRLWWNLIGREVVSVQEGVLIVARLIGPLRTSASYSLSDVRDLRYAPLTLRLWNVERSTGWMGLPIGKILFECADKTYTFGIRLPESDAKRVIAEISPRCKAAVALPATF